MRYCHELNARPSHARHTQEYRLVVLTPQILVNALEAGEAHFSKIALLVSTAGRSRHSRRG